MNYNNIKTCEKHKKAHITEDLFKKLKDKTMRALSLGGVMLVFFTGCSGQTTSKEDVENTKLPSNKLEDKIDEGTSYNNIEEIIDVDETTTLEDKTQETTTSRGDEVERPSNKQENDIATYNKLLNNMNAELNKKDFSKEAKEAFKDVLDSLYKNYPTWQSVYKDLPPVEEYIENNLINTIKDINSISIYDANSEEGKKLQEEGEALGKVDANWNITMIFRGEEEHQEDVERFFHEIIHIKQKNIVFNDSYYNGNEELRTIILEGSTTFNQKFVNPLTPKVGGTWAIANEKGTRKLNYNNDTGIGYLVELNAYENLVYLAGYNTMDKVEKGEISLSELKGTIAENYGQNKSNKIWDKMTEWYGTYKSEGWQSDKAYQTGIEVQKLYLECIKQDIEQLNHNQIEKYMDIYRNYKLKNLPQVLDSNENNITNEIFDIDTLDNLMVDKIVEANVMNFTSNEQENRKAIKAVLYASNEAYYDTSGIYQNKYLPSKIADAEYKYENGKMIMTYEDENGKIVNLQVVFDSEKGTIKETETTKEDIER